MRAERAHGPLMHGSLKLFWDGRCALHPWHMHVAQLNQPITCYPDQLSCLKPMRLADLSQTELQWAVGRCGVGNGKEGQVVA